MAIKILETHESAENHYSATRAAKTQFEKLNFLPLTVHFPSLIVSRAEQQRSEAYDK